MAARIILPVFALAACGASAPDSAPRQPTSFSGRWQVLAQPGLRLEECLIKVRLPNPQYPADYQELVRRVWQSRSARHIPVFFTYSHGRDLFVILDADCSRRADFARDLDSQIHSDDRLRPYQVRIVQPEEARAIISFMDNMMEGVP